MHLADGRTRRAAADLGRPARPGRRRTGALGGPPGGRGERRRGRAGRLRRRPQRGPPGTPLHPGPARPGRLCRACGGRAGQAAVDAARLGPRTWRWPSRPRPGRPSPPDAAAWLTVAEAEYARLDERPDPQPAAAAAAWEALGRPYPAAYCRWRLGRRWWPVPPAPGVAPRRDRPGPHARPTRWPSALGAQPLRHELELLAQRSRLDLAGPPPPGQPEPVETLGLTAREGEVLAPAHPGLHQPGDRRRADHQRQDRQRARLPHPAQARCLPPGRSRRDRAPARASPHRAGAFINVVTPPTTAPGTCPTSRPSRRSARPPSADCPDRRRAASIGVRPSSAPPSRMWPRDR